MTTERFALHPFLHSAALIEDELRRRLSGIGVRPRQARVLDALARMGPTSQVRLARAVDVGAASMSTMTARLIEDGHVTRETDPEEARANILRLTEAGRGLLSEIHAAWRDVDALIEERIGSERAATLTTAALALRDALGGCAPFDTDGARTKETS